MTHSWSARRRLVVPVLASVAALGLVAGCASTVTGRAAPAASAVVSTGDPSTDDTATDDTATQESVPPTDTVTDRTVAPSDDPTTDDTDGPPEGESVEPAEFAKSLQEGMSDVTSMAFSATTRAAGQSIEISGEQTVQDGLATAARMTFDGPISLEFLLVDDKIYIGGDAKLLRTLGADDPDVEWVVADEDSSNRQLATIAEQMQASLDQSGPASYLVLAEVLSSVTKTGEKSADGLTLSEYVVVVDVDDFAETNPSNKQAAAALEAAGIDELEMTMLLDDKNRLQRFVQEFEISGQSVRSEFVVSDYNAPVTIEAPDPATVSDGS